MIWVWTYVRPVDRLIPAKKAETRFVVSKKEEKKSTTKTEYTYATLRQTHNVLDARAVIFPVSRSLRDMCPSVDK